jgi:choloylglycine hydrolase
MGFKVSPTGNGSGLLGIPGDVTPPSRFVRATMLTAVTTSAAGPDAAVNAAFHALDLVSVPRQVASSGDYTQWYVARDHDRLIYYVRSYDGWTTAAHDLTALSVSDPSSEPRTLPLPAA